MRIIKAFIFLISIAFVQSCGTPKQAATSVIVAATYNKQTDTTVFVMIPQGNVSIKGDWQKAGYNPSSRQHFLLNEATKDMLSIAKNPATSYSFFAADKTNYSLVHAFYKWEADYWVTNGAQQEILKENKEKAYIIWRVFNSKVDNVFIFGMRGAFLTNYSIASGKIGADEKIAFLEDLYLKN